LGARCLRRRRLRPQLRDQRCLLGQRLALRQHRPDQLILVDRIRVQHAPILPAPT
jgi:hypothetical protein